jgi:hypothetical protein
MESSPLGAIPPELIFQTLDFMEPHEFSGLSCTCQHALRLVNLYLKPYEFGGFDFLGNSKSRTAWFVDHNRALVNGELQESDCAAIQYFDETVDDPDL